MMAEWSSYSLDDFLMYSPRAWYRMLASHNDAWWPLQTLAALLGLAAMAGLLRRSPQAVRLALALAGAGLLFVAGAFHAGPHADINLAAPYFAAAFGVEGVALIAVAMRSRPVALPVRIDGPCGLALALLATALLLYPLLALAALRPLAQAEWFALAPDPTMLAALALVVLWYRGLASRRARAGAAVLAILPLAWCAVSGLTLWTLGAPDWWPMPAGAVLAVGAAIWPRARPLAP